MGLGSSLFVIFVNSIFVIRALTLLLIAIPYFIQP
jgi:hypothetical protein